MLAYWKFLNDRLSNEQFMAAARTVWATSRFFPRPADFLLAAYPRTLPELNRAADAWQKDRHVGGWTNGLSQLALGVLHMLGGYATTMRHSTWKTGGLNPH